MLSPCLMGVFMDKAHQVGVRAGAKCEPPAGLRDILKPLPSPARSK